MSARERSPARYVVGAILVAGAIAAGVYVGLRKNETDPFVRIDPEPATEAPVDAGEATAPRHPIGDALGRTVEPSAPAEPLPALADSDAAMLAALGALFGADPLQAYGNPEFVIQRIVATVDNLPRRKIAPQANPVKPVPGALGVEPDPGEASRATLAPANYRRYAPHVAAAEAVDVAALTATYVRHYPLFQAAYREIAPPGAYFNDRVVEVIDHLIAAPDATGPVVLVRDRAYWAYADPTLEARSAGEKLMLRLGPANAASVRRKLGELRAAIAARGTITADAPVAPAATSSEASPEAGGDAAISPGAASPMPESLPADATPATVTPLPETPNDAPDPPQ